MIQPGSHIHLVGIGGTGLSAIARVLLERGMKVSGSDQTPSPLSQALEEAGATIYRGHRGENIAGADLVVQSSAVKNDNPEIRAAVELGVPVYKRSEFLGKLLAGIESIAIAGSHGKTTTTAMIAWMLSGLGLDPGYIIGGVSNELGANAHAGHGKLFVIEADEYDWMFLGLAPKIAILTSVEHDHPDLFTSVEMYRQAFVDFTRRIQPDGLLIGCLDDPGAAWVMEQAAQNGIETVGYTTRSTSGAVYRAGHLIPNDLGGFDFDVTYTPPGIDPQQVGDMGVTVSLRVPGEHNVKNALAALAVAHRLELPVQVAALFLGEFTGTGRRFEVLGEAAGVIFVDDYGHHPTEIRATLSAARSRYPDRKIWAVWQPHTYSRTRTLFEQFVEAFEDADRVMVTDIYPSRETIDPSFSSRQVVEAMRHTGAVFTGSLADSENYLLQNLTPGSVVVVLSAGDATQIGRNVLSALEGRSTLT